LHYTAVDLIQVFFVRFQVSFGLEDFCSMVSVVSLVLWSLCVKRAESCCGNCVEKLKKGKI